MCGFSVYSKKYTNFKNAIHHSKKFVQFRGLDATETLDNRDHIFVHHRLSIVDHNNGLQPVSNDSGILVYNGEIHNFSLLGRKYYDQEFTGDTQFLFRLCLDNRLDLLSEVDGYFAFVYFDNSSREFTIARDFYGEKPLYASSDLLNFSSSINAVAELGPNNFTTKLRSLFAEERVEWQRILFKDFFEVPPNTLMKVSAEGLLLSKKIIYNTQLTKFEVENFMNQFDKAVENRMVADVGVAQSLSGGKDSGLVNISLLRSNLSVPRFTIKNTKQKFDESYFVKKIAAKYDIPLKIVEPTTKLGTDELVKTLVYQEVPSWDFGFIGFYIYYVEIAQSAKVILEGHGPDELHGGYQDFLMVKCFHNLFFHPRLFKQSFKELKIKTDRSFSSLFVSAILFLMRGAFLGKLEYISLRHYWKRQEKRLNSVLAVFDRATMHAQIESRSPFLSFKMNSFFRNYQREKNALISSKPYITECLAVLGDDYPLLNKKIGFTFGKNDAHLEFGKQILSYKQIKIIQVLYRVFPKKFVNRFAMFQIFHAAHLDYRNKSSAIL